MKPKKPWGGRFAAATAPSVEAFTQSVSFDQRLYEQDIQGSIVHARMLAKCGLISAAEQRRIAAGLRGILRDIQAGKFQFREELEDVHMNIESALVDRIGAAGRKLHTARSRNDQVAMDLRLWTRQEVGAVSALIRDLQRALVAKARENADLVLPGFTHVQHAQPVLAAHYLLAYVEMLERDKARLADCLKRVNVSPLGACALAGTGLPTDPALTAKALGFEGVCANSLDAVSDRDFCLEFAFGLALIALHLSRLAEEWILWASEEFGFLDLADAFCTGSSIMPQKKNPDVLELIRGKAGRVFGHLVSLLTMMKGLPLAYNRDMQEDKEAIFDAADTVKGCLSMAAELTPQTRFRRERVAEALRRGFLDATALADYLVKRGLAFRDAHRVVGGLVKECAASGKALADLSLAQLRRHS
ncbi:MAG: argininosuccinate lyase, partial [Planctomycetes bacterium]|nr:argininosuccinate lyase [Planctomycetota bacterium]